MSAIKDHIKRVTRVALCGVFGFVVLTPAALALPTSVEDEISALNISESEFETELGIETVYEKLENIAHRICASGLYQALQPQSLTSGNCAVEMMDSFVSFIGHDRLLAYHERQRDGALA